MKKAFKSKIGFLLISILLILVSAEAYMIYTMTIAGIIAVGVLIIFFVYMYMDTLYVLTSDKKLKIKSGKWKTVRYLFNFIFVVFTILANILTSSSASL